MFSASGGTKAVLQPLFRDPFVGLPFSRINCPLPALRQLVTWLKELDRKEDAKTARRIRIPRMGELTELRRRRRARVPLCAPCVLPLRSLRLGSSGLRSPFLPSPFSPVSLFSVYLRALRVSVVNPPSRYNLHWQFSRQLTSSSERKKGAAYGTQLLLSYVSRSVNTLALLIA